MKNYRKHSTKKVINKKEKYSSFIGSITSQNGQGDCNN